MHYSKIVNDFIINSILVGFISMLSLAGGIAFGLGGKNLAEETLTGMKNRTSRTASTKISPEETGIG